MSDSNDGSSGPPESPDLEVDNSGLRERQVPPSVERGPATQVAPARAGAAAGAGPQLPAVPEGVMARASVKPTTSVGTSLVPNTEPSAELATRPSTPQPEPAPAELAPESSAPESGAPESGAPESGAPTSVAPASQPSVLQVLAPHMTEEQVAARRRDKLRGLMIIGGTFVACILLSVWGKTAAEPEESLPPRPPTTAGIAGWPDKVDPFASLALARGTSQRDLLRGIVAEHVSSDGTVDFKKGAGSVRYSFQSEPGHGPQPPRDPNTVPRRSYCGKQSVHIQRHGLVADPDVPAFPCSAKARDSLPNPECTTKQIWDYALAHNVPKNKPARIEYYAAKSGPAYRFTVTGTPHRIVLSHDCKTEVKPLDTHGGVP